MPLKKWIASALPLGLLCCRAVTAALHWDVYRRFWFSGGFDWLRMPLPYAVPVFLLWLACILAVQWGPFLVPLWAAAAPWLPRPLSQRVYTSCIIACIPMFLGEGLLHLIRLLALDSAGWVCEMPLADLLLLGICLLGRRLHGKT